MSVEQPPCKIHDIQVNQAPNPVPSSSVSAHSPPVKYAFLQLCRPFRQPASYSGLSEPDQQRISPNLGIEYEPSWPSNEY